ncbi:MAG: DUF3800 domain-containing protein [Bacteroidia bacterium]
MKNQIAFIDESGNNGLDFNKEGVSSHFIVTAILFDVEVLPAEEKVIEAIRKKFFQTGEIKSSNIADDDTRRIKILEALNQVNYHIFSIVIDKRELKTEGFQYKASFYKFLHSLVDKELFRVFPRIQIVADEHGGAEFKQGFIKYIRDNHVTDLFNQDFDLSDSKSELAVQLADFISGTLARCYETTKISNSKSEFLKILKEKIIEVRTWPTEFTKIQYSNKERTSSDDSIAELSLFLASQYITKHSNSNVPSVIHQVACLRYLIFYFKNINADRYIPTYELINNIETIKGGNITMHYFRSKIIAHLRDNNVLLSSSHRGYKLPSRNSDLIEFVYHSNSYIEPMIDRILVCRKLVKLATKNNIDILDNPGLKYLSELKKDI